MAATGSVLLPEDVTGTLSLTLPIPILAMLGSNIQMVQSLNSPHARRKLRAAIAKPGVMIAKRLGAVVQIQNRATAIRNVYAYPLSERDTAGAAFGMDVDERQRIFIVPALQGSLLAKVIATAITSNVVTLTCSKKHWFVIGQEIRVTMDDEDDDIDGLDYTVAGVPSDAGLTYSKTASDRAEATAYGSVEAIIRPGDTIWFESEPYAIDTIEPDQYRSSYRLTCTSTRARTLGAF
jgi:hypothetical protein